MGITGLLPLLYPLSRDVHISEFRGKTVAVDGFSWLHKGTYGCAWDLCLNKPTRKYVDYIINRCEALIFHGVTPLIVFDGARLAGKSETNDGRKMQREKCLKEGKNLWVSIQYDLYIVIYCKAKLYPSRHKRKGYRKALKEANLLQLRTYNFNVA